MEFRFSRFSRALGITLIAVQALFLCLLFILPPSFATAGDASIGKDLQSDLRHKSAAVKKAKDPDPFIRVKKSTRALVDAIDRGKDISEHLNTITADFADIEAEHSNIEKQFQESEAKIRAAGVSTILSRHREAVEKYQKKKAELKSHIDAVKRAKDKKEHEELRQKAKGLADFIDQNTKEEYHLKDSSGLPWKVVEPGDIPLLGDSSGMPQSSVSVTSKDTPAASDLSQTVDVQITPEIQDLARSLDNHPLKIFRHVYNNYNFTPYNGSVKGSLDTYWEKEGNDYDLSSLLIALLRASNIPARYVRAKVLLPVEKIQKWTGISDPMAALQYLSSANIPVSYYTTAGRISHVILTHVYVEAYITYSLSGPGYRGSGQDAGGPKYWIPMDPSFKEYKVIQVGTDIASQMGFDWKAFSDEYLGEIRNVTPIEFYKGKVDEYIGQNYSGQTIDTLKRVTSIKTMLFDFLPNTLPYNVTEVIDHFSEIPQEFRHTVRFTIPNVLDYSTSLPEISGRRITLSFEGATADDQTVIDQYGGIFKTPPYLIEIKPVLRISGSRVADGAAMNAGISSSFSVTYTQAGGKTDAFEHHIMTGSFNAVGITTGNVRPEFLTIAEVEASEEPYMSKMLHSLVMKYQNQQNVTKQVLNDTMKTRSKTFFSEALVSSKEDIRSAYGIPLSFDLGGFMIDAKEMSSVIIPVDGYNTKKVIDFAMVYGHEASYQENRTFEDSMFWLNGWSAVKGLQMLKAMDVAISELSPPLTYTNANLPNTVVTDINNALNMGWQVIVPDETGGLPVVPYIKYDPKTGSAGYMIAAMAGGFNLNISPIGHEADLTFVKDIFLSENIKINYEILFPDSPYQVAMGDSFILGVKVTAETTTGERAILEQMILIDTDRTHYIAGHWPLYAFVPGRYKIKFDGKDLFAFHVYSCPFIEADSIDANDPANAKVNYRIVPSEQSFDTVTFEVSGTTKSMSKVAGNFNFTFDQNSLPLGNSLIKVTAANTSNVSAQCSATITNFVSVARNERRGPMEHGLASGKIIVEIAKAVVIATIYVNHDLFEIWHGFEYSIPLMVGSRTIWTGQSSVNVRTQDLGLIPSKIATWNEKHFYSDGNGVYFEKMMRDVTDETAPPQGDRFKSKDSSNSYFFKNHNGLTGSAVIDYLSIEDDGGEVNWLSIPLPGTSATVRKKID